MLGQGYRNVLKNSSLILLGSFLEVLAQALTRAHAQSPLLDPGMCLGNLSVFARSRQMSRYQPLSIMRAELRFRRYVAGAQEPMKSRQTIKLLYAYTEDNS